MSLFEENFRLYKPGGFHPVMPGEVYEDRYKIVYKLGAGGYSTFKVAEPADYDHEEALLQFVEAQKHNPHVSHPGKHHIVDLLDAFTSTSANGTHRVLVTNVVRPVSFYRPVTQSAWGLAAYQLTSALDFLHNHGIVHLDMHSLNVGFAIALTDEMVAELPEQGTNELVDRDDVDWTPHLPHTLIDYEWWMKDWDLNDLIPLPDPAALRVQILDLGSAHSSLHADPRPHFYPKKFPMPEFRIGHEPSPFSPALDIWDLAHLFFSLEFGETLFGMIESMHLGAFIDRCLDIHPSPTGATADRLLALPERWRAAAAKTMADDLQLKTRSRPKAADPAAALKASYPYCECKALEFGPWGDPDPTVYRGYHRPRTEKAKEAAAEHLEEFWTTFRKMAALDPAERPSAAALLREPYMNRWRRVTSGDQGPAADKGRQEGRGS
ncbi:MAG: hypothetical protein Q9162_006836 [Coniocarpon cinnabarinum]